MIPKSELRVNVSTPVDIKTNSKKIIEKNPNIKIIALILFSFMNANSPPIMKMYIMVSK